ncbi:hypothetical protein [Streptomyces sp. NBC_01304]|uniref:hypothetical protein n=1 Tax=Streptomyces sp. NBC_01304 TaxID=2903818 RepID=UPI002E0FFF85|nr:hypothetical protein OG430_48760 [Streptomyces sp. NBC_01304]
MAPAPEDPSTGIPNADELITLARAFGLNVTVDTTAGDTLMSHIVHVSIPVPVAYAGTELGRAIGSANMTMLWTRNARKGSRGRLEDATVFSVVDSRKVRTLRQVTATVRNLGEDSNSYARDAAPHPQDVVDAPHALFLDGRQVRGTVTAAGVRHVVATRRFKGWLVHQDADNTIHSGNCRYVPMGSTDATADAP